jgi:uncharacterized protein
MRVSVTDRLEIADRRTTADGYLAVRANIARTGVYQYTRRDLGLKDGNPLEMVGVYRPEDTVFSDESLASFAHRPITIGHPIGDVNAKTWKRLSVGHTGEKVRRDGDHVVCDMLLMDQSGIDAAQNSHKELSAGYSADIELEDGTAPDGTPYAAIMRGPLRGNHIALVPRGRAGSTCRIGDAAWPVDDISPKHKEPTSVKTYMLDGLPVRYDDEAALDAAFAKLATRVTDAESARDAAIADKATAEAATATAATAHVTAIEAKDAEIATLTATNATLTAELSDARDPAKLRDAATEYANTVAKAKALGATIADNASTADVKRAAVNIKLGDAAKDWTDAQVDVSFATLAASVKDAKPDAFRDAMSQRQPADFADAAAKAKEARQKMIDGMVNPTVETAK